MTAFRALFTCLCGFRKKTRALKTNEKRNQSFPPRETSTKEQTRDDLQNKEPVDRVSNAYNDDNNNADSALPLPPARKAALRETYSCNNMTMLQKSGSIKQKLTASLTIQMSRVSSFARRHDGEEDKSVKNKKLKAEKSILVRPIILGEKCRVLVDEEGDEDDSQRMPKNRIYRPRSMSSISISISRTNSKINMNVTPVKETSEDIASEVNLGKPL